MNLRDLQHRGFLETDQALNEAAVMLKSERDADNTLPWIARTAMGIGAWLSGIFFMIFIMLVTDGLEDGAAVFPGALIIAGSVALLRSNQNHFLQQLGLALCFCGHLLFFYGLSGISNLDTLGSFIGALIICAPVFWLSKHNVQRFLSVLWIWITGWISLMDFGYNLSIIPTLLLCCSLITILFFLSGKLTQRMWAAALWASLSGFIGLFLWVDSDVDRMFHAGLKSTMGIFFAIGFSSLLYYLERPTQKQRIGFAVFSLLLIGLGLAGAPGIISGLGLMAIAHSRKERALAWVAVGALTLFLISFYYHLAIPLNHKSFVLMISGTLLLGFRLLFSNKAEAS